MEEKEENVVEETTQETVKTVDESKFESAGDDSVIKVDLSKKPEEVNETKEEVVENNTDDGGVVELTENTDTTQAQEEVQPEAEAQEEIAVLEEITDEEVKEEVEEV